MTDTDTPWQSDQDLGGATLTIERRYGTGTAHLDYWVALLELGAVERPRLHRAAGDNRFGGDSTQRQWTQEVRYAGDLTDDLNFVGGAFLFRQGVDSDPVIRQEQGAAAARFLLRLARRLQRRDSSRATDSTSI